MDHAVYDIWKVESVRHFKQPWRLQLINYVAHFPSEAAAQHYLDFVKKERKKFGLP